MSLKEVERLLTLVEGSLRCTPRNAYEAQNNFHTSIDRLSAVRKILAGFSGDYVDVLYRRTDQVERRVNESAGKIGSSQNTVARGAFALDVGLAHASVVDDNELDSGAAMGAHMRCGAECRTTTMSKPGNKPNAKKSSKKHSTTCAQTSVEGNVDKEAAVGVSTRAKTSGKNTIRDNHKRSDDDAAVSTTGRATQSTRETKTCDDCGTAPLTECTRDDVADGLHKAKQNSQYRRDAKRLGTGTHEEETDTRATANTATNGTSDRKSSSRECSPGEQQPLLRQSIHIQAALPKNFLQDVCNGKPNTASHDSPSSHALCADVWDECAYSSSTRVGTCTPIIGTALVRVDLDSAVRAEDDTQVIRLELYRCVLLALTYGTPVAPLPMPESSTSAAVASGMQAQKSKDCIGSESATGRHTQPQEPSGSDAGACDGVVSSIDAVLASTPSDRSDVLHDSQAEEEEEVSTEYVDGVEELSRQLIAEYDAAQAQIEEEETFGEVPRFVSLNLCRAICTSTQRTWVILLCHGGCFAGGVYKDGRCVVHKTLQRYVVRKKQGGKQSSQNDGGSFHSAGSLIRAGQELKWRLDVREVLLEWRAHIETASIILYAAPGPQNRAILTDFTAIPASKLTGTSANLKSPVRVGDARVCGVPFTTHKPTYKEVERVYSLVSDVTVVSTQCT